MHGTNNKLFTIFNRRRKSFYDAFEFFPHDENTDFFGWSHIPINRKCLKHLSWSKRLQYLN